MKPNAKLATLSELRPWLGEYLHPLPQNDRSLVAWFRAANVARFKANPAARRGGGPVYYSVSDIEDYLRLRTVTTATLNP